MFTQAELEDAVNELLDGKHSIQNCERLAAIYTVLDHLYKEEKPMIQASHDNKTESEIGRYGNSKFLKTIAGKPSKDAWIIMDELVEAVTVLNPRLTANFYEKLNTI